MKNQSNTVLQKENDNFPETKLKVMGYCNVADRELKIVIMKILSELQGNSESQSRDFPGGTVVKNPPANAGDMGSSPGSGKSHMPWSN